MNFQEPPLPLLCIQFNQNHTKYVQDQTQHTSSQPNQPPKLKHPTRELERDADHQRWD